MNILQLFGEFGCNRQNFLSVFLETFLSKAFDPHQFALCMRYDWCNSHQSALMHYHIRRHIVFLESCHSPFLQLFSQLFIDNSGFIISLDNLLQPSRLGLASVLEQAAGLDSIVFLLIEKKKKICYNLSQLYTIILGHTRLQIEYLRNYLWWWSVYVWFLSAFLCCSPLHCVSLQMSRKRI